MNDISAARWIVSRSDISPHPGSLRSANLRRARRRSPRRVFGHRPAPPRNPPDEVGARRDVVEAPARAHGVGDNQADLDAADMRPAGEEPRPDRSRRDPADIGEERPSALVHTFKAFDAISEPPAR